MDKGLFEVGSDGTRRITRLSQMLNVGKERGEVLGYALSLYSFIIEELFNRPERKLAIIEGGKILKMIKVPGLAKK